MATTVVLVTASQWISLEGLLTVAAVAMLLALLAWWAIREHWAVDVGHRGRPIRTAAGKVWWVFKGGRGASMDGRSRFVARGRRRRGRGSRNARKQAR
jgi:hypothetical protein